MDKILCKEFFFLFLLFYTNMISYSFINAYAHIFVGYIYQLIFTAIFKKKFYLFKRILHQIENIKLLIDSFFCFVTQ